MLFSAVRRDPAGRHGISRLDAFALVEDLDRFAALDSGRAINKFCDVGKSRGLRSVQRRIRRAAAL
jgi:hypothetical protein